MAQAEKATQKNSSCVAFLFGLLFFILEKFLYFTVN